MAVVTGYMTNPNLSDREYYENANFLKKIGLEVRLFDLGTQGRNIIGPFGYLISGKNEVLDLNVIKQIIYKWKGSQNNYGLAFDLSQENSTLGKDYEDLALLKFKKFDSYFSFEVVGGSKNELERNLFNKNHFAENYDSAVRRVGNNNFRYDFLTKKRYLDIELNNKRDFLKENGFVIMDDRTTIIDNLIKY